MYLSVDRGEMLPEEGKPIKAVCVYQHGMWAKPHLAEQMWCESSPVVKVVEMKPLRMACWAACRRTVYSVVSESPSRRIHVSSASTISSCTWVPEGGRHQEQQMRKAMGSLKSKRGGKGSHKLLQSLVPGRGALRGCLHPWTKST